MEANEEEYWRKNSGMDVRRPLPGERDGAQMLRMAIDAYKQGRRRGREAKHFLDAVRATSLEGAVADTLLLAGGAGPSAVGLDLQSRQV
ncbi:hypothetical protein CF319_g8714 [Tilletia indica]|nr:hypothetical protein CF319_g8714 [Tilletia indica]